MNLNNFIQSSLSQATVDQADKEPPDFSVVDGAWKSSILYKQNSTGKIQCWQVWVDKGNHVTTEYGQVDGQLMTTLDVIKGKNTGKANETTDEQQARLKAEQLFEKKTKEGYVRSIEVAKQNTNNLQGVPPMLAFPSKDKMEHVVFPAVFQPKLDGMRCIAVITQNGDVKLYSRTQKQIMTLPHIEFELREMFTGVDIILDGELYNHDLKDDFNRIMSLIKRDTTHPEASDYIQYHVYDRIDLEEGSSWIDRFGFIEPIIRNYGFSVKLVESVVVEQPEGHLEDEFKKYFTMFTKAGYEGAMYRNALAPYETKRSTTLLKIKSMLDEEFEIVGVLEGNGKLRGKAGSFVLKTWDGKEFKAKLKGELDALEEYFVNFDKYRGKMLTVQYQNLTPDGIPRFPVGLRIRTEE